MGDIVIPKLSEVAVIRLCITAESWVDSWYDCDGNLETDNEAAKHEIDMYAAPLRATLPDRLDVSDTPKESDYVEDQQAYYLNFTADVTPEQWREIADGFGIDLENEDGELMALPSICLVHTMGILGEDGITPAMAIEETEQGSSRLIASFYVALFLKEEYVEKYQ